MAIAVKPSSTGRRAESAAPIGATTLIAGVDGTAPSRLANVLNAVLFQLLWCCSVLGAGVYGYPWLALLGAIPLLLSVLRLPGWRADLRLAAWLVPLGWALDSLWAVTGVLVFHGSAVAPLWIAVLWFGVALSVNHSLAMLRDRPRISAIGVGVFAPFSYFGGSKLGAVTIPALPPLLMVGVAWALVFALLFALALREKAE